MIYKTIKTIILSVMLMMACMLIYNTGAKAEETASVKTATADSKTAKQKTTYVTSTQLDSFDVKFEKGSYTVIKGDTITLTLDTNIPIESYYTECSLNTYNASAISIPGEQNKVVVSGNFAGESDSILKVTLKVSFCDANGAYLGERNYAATTKIKVLDVLERTAEIGEKIPLDRTSYDTYKNMHYEISNTEVLRLKSGKFVVIGTGISYIYLVNDAGKKVTVAMIEGVNQGEIAASIDSSVTPEITLVSDDSGAEAINVAVGYNVDIFVKGATGIVSWASADASIAQVFSNTYSGVQASATVYGIKTGSTTVTATVNGVTLSVKIIVNNPKISTTFLVVPKGSKQVIKINGIDKASEVSYKSYNMNVATVSAKGIIKTLKKGYCPILVTADGAQYVVNVNVTSTKAVKAVMNAINAEGSTYSQARRMEEGYYDCSSLVWRSYSPLKMYFGKKKYAPVAADEAKYLVKKGKTVDLSYINKLKKLRAGDLFFYSGSKNGRYKSIRHVAIFTGIESEYFGGKFYSNGKIIHANGRSVSQAYIYNESNISVIGRPF